MSAIFFHFTILAFFPFYIFFKNSDFFMSRITDLDYI